MNKEEIEAKLRNYEERLKDIAKAIEELREQLEEDLEKVYTGSSCRLLEISGSNIGIYFSTNTNSVKEIDFISLCLDEAEYLSCKLNQMIAELKRKENSCS